MSDIRRDPVSGLMTVIAPARAGRPRDFSRAEEEAASAGSCPFCPGREEMTPPTLFEARLPGSETWTVRAFENKFPAVSAAGATGPTLVDAPAPYQATSAFGGHEVIVETPEHTQGLADYSYPHARLVVDAYVQRLTAWRDDGRVAQPVLFRNWGKAAGASLAHPHSQLITLADVPEAVEREAANFAAGARDGGCVLCEAIEADAAAGRTLFEAGDFAVQVPYASLVPYAIRIAPKSCSGTPLDLTEDGRGDLGESLTTTAKLLKAIMGDPPFNLAFHIAPYERGGNLVHYHWHISVVPRTSIFAGFEWVSGYRLNPVDPDDAAAAFREAYDRLHSGDETPDHRDVPTHA